MKLFGVFANIIAALFVWLILTGGACFFVIWCSDAAPVQWAFWPWIIAVLAVSFASFRLYARQIWKKLSL